MEKAKISGKSPAISAVVYDRLKGVDYSTDPALIDSERSPYAPNLISGPGGFPEKRPGWRTILQLEEPIYGIHAAYKDGDKVYLIHAGKKLYEWSPDAQETGAVVYDDMRAGPSKSFVHKSRAFILDGRNYICVGDDLADGEWGATLVYNIAKVPTVYINSSPFGLDGVPLEDPNLLNHTMTVSYVGEGEETEHKAPELYKLPFRADDGEPVKVRVKDEDDPDRWREYEAFEESSSTILIERVFGTASDKEGYPSYDGMHFKATVNEEWKDDNPRGFVVDHRYGIVAFAVPPWDARDSGVDNVEITFYPNDSKFRDGGLDNSSVRTIDHCDTFTIYENRVWATGNKNLPGYDWHSGVDDPTYFPQTGYAKVGEDNTRIMGYLKSGSSLAIIKGESSQDACIYLRTAGTLQDYAAFPLKQGVIGQGAISPHAFGNILDDPLFLTRSGVCAVSSSLITEQRTIANRSRFINPKLTENQNLSNAVACNWNGMYLLSMTDGNVYLMDGKQDRVYLENSLTGASYNYECYHWTNMPATAWMPDGDKLYFGTADGRVCKLNTDIEGVGKYNDDGKPIKAARATRVEFCGDWLRYKTMVKKGSGALMQPYTRSSAKVWVRTDRTKAQEFLTAALDNDGWDESLPDDYASWKEAQILPFKKKIKKWKWIQVILENDTINEGFGVYGVIIRYQKQNLA